MNLPVEKRWQWIRSRRQQRKLTKLARLRRQLIRYVVLALLLFLGTAAFYKMSWYLPVDSSNSQAVCIKGNSVASNQQILQALYKSTDLPLFAINPSELENKIERLDIVQQVFVRRYALPYPKLQVEVLEEFPWATLYLNDAPSSQFVIAQSGRLISIHDFSHVYQPALRIYGQSKNDIKLVAADVNRWANRIAYIEKQTQSPVFSIDLRDSHNVKIETAKFTIALGSTDSSLTPRLYRLASVLDILASEHKQPSYVNLGLNSNIPVKLAANEPTQTKQRL